MDLKMEFQYINSKTACDYTKPLWFKPTRIQLLAVATCITAANNFFGDEAPAIQLSEHAQAVLADDAEHGFVRNDPVLRRMAAGSGML